MIDLGKDVFDFNVAVKIQADDPLFINVFHNKKVVSVVDFGTIFIGNVQEDDFEFFRSERQSLNFEAPTDWRMPQIMKRIGVFSSTSQARKNGWDQDIPVGFSTFLVRINKLRGEIAIFKDGGVDHEE